MSVTYVPLEKIIKEMRAGTISPGPAKPCLEHLIKEMQTEIGTDARRKVQLVPRPSARSSRNPDVGTDARRKVEYVGRNDPSDGPSKDGSLPVSTDNSTARQAAARNVIDEESPLDDVQKFVARIKPGFGNPVNLEPRTNDRPVSNEREDEAAKRARKQQNAAIGAPGNTMKEEEVLTELFNQPYQTTKRTEPGLTVGTFKTEHGNPYEVTVANQGKQAHVSFEHPEHGMSKAGAPIEARTAHRVFGTVKDTVLDHGKRHPGTKFLSFSASGDEPSRIKLYHHLAKSIDKDYIHRINDYEDHDFHARNPHYVSETLAVDSPMIDPVTKKNKGMATKLQGFSKIISKVSQNRSGAALTESGNKWSAPTASYNRIIGPRIEKHKIGIGAALRKHKRLAAPVEGRLTRFLVGKVMERFGIGAKKPKEDAASQTQTKPAGQVGTNSSAEDRAAAMRQNTGKRDPYARAVGQNAVADALSGDLAKRKLRRANDTSVSKGPPSLKQQQRASATNKTFDNRHQDPDTANRVKTVTDAGNAAAERIMKRRNGNNPQIASGSAAEEGKNLRRAAGFND